MVCLWIFIHVNSRAISSTKCTQSHSTSDQAQSKVVTSEAGADDFRNRFTDLPKLKKRKSSQREGPRVVPIKTKSQRSASTEKANIRSWPRAREKELYSFDFP